MRSARNTQRALEAEIGHARIQHRKAIGIIREQQRRLPMFSIGINDTLSLPRFTWSARVSEQRLVDDPRGLLNDLVADFAGMLEAEFTKGRRQ